MHASKKTNNFISNLTYAFTAQGISFFLSILISLVVPKLLGVEEFSYWQLFLFYSTFTAFFQFGLNDGIYLRYGGITYEKIDHKLIGSQFWTSVVVQVFLCASVALYAILFVTDRLRSFVLIASAIYMLITNLIGFLGVIFQATNRTKDYSLSYMISNILFIFSVITLMICREKHFEMFVDVFLVTRFVSLLFFCLIGRKIVNVRLNPIGITLYEIKKNISIGINLMFSNIASMLVLGVGRFVTDSLWGITTFGKFSFALSLTSFFLLFISQISMVLFPALRQTDEKKLQEFYKIGRDLLGIVLAAVFLVYMPMQYILGLWLPQYHQSLQYLALLLPLCTFDGKMQMLCSTYMKVMRKERVLLAFNMITLALSVILSLIGGYLLHSIYAIVISMVIVVAFRSVISELYLSKIMNISLKKCCITISIECALAAVFVLCTWFLSPLYGFVIYFVVYSMYLYFSKEKILRVLGLAKSMFFRKSEDVTIFAE